MFRSHDIFPPGGWPFIQPQTGWQAPANMSFNAVVQAIIDHRRNNPRFGLPTDREAVATELDEYNTARLEGTRGAEGYLLRGTGPIPKFTPRGAKLATAPVGVVAKVAKAIEIANRPVAGIGLLWDWLGHGGIPVPRELAEKRAAVCAGNADQGPCPQNKPANLRQWVYSRTANSIAILVGMKNKLECKTTLDHKLFACNACDCHLALKVHCPIEHILKHEKPSAKQQLDPRCWVLSEEREITPAK